MSIRSIAPACLLLSLLLPASAPVQAQINHGVPLVTDSIRIDGILDEPVWRVSDSLSLVLNNNPSGGKPKSATSVRLAWSQAELFVAFTVESRNVEGTVTRHDGPLYEQDVVELFIDPDGDSRNYLELEWNCLNTSLDYRYAGVRTGMDSSWRAKGMRNAVKVQGTANKSSDIDTGMIVEIAIPWTDIKDWSNSPMPPRVGDKLRVNFYRIDYPPTGDEELMAWSPTGVADFHRPDRFGQLTFEGASASITWPGEKRIRPGIASSMETGVNEGVLRVSPDGRLMARTGRITYPIRKAGR